MVLEIYRKDRALQVIGQLFPAWPIWALDDEENLMLTDKELEVMQDTKYGHDLRQLTRSDVVTMLPARL